MKYSGACLWHKTSKNINIVLKNLRKQSPDESGWNGNENSWRVLLTVTGHRIELPTTEWLQCLETR